MYCINSFDEEAYASKPAPTVANSPNATTMIAECQERGDNVANNNTTSQFLSQVALEANKLMATADEQQNNVTPVATTSNIDRA